MLSFNYPDVKLWKLGAMLELAIDNYDIIVTLCVTEYCRGSHEQTLQRLELLYIL